MRSVDNILDDVELSERDRADISNRLHRVISNNSGITSAIDRAEDIRKLKAELFNLQIDNWRLKAQIMAKIISIQDDL